MTERFKDFVTENDRDELLNALRVVGQWIGDESQCPVRYDPNCEMHKLIVQLAIDIQIWEQDSYYQNLKEMEK